MSRREWVAVGDYLITDSDMKGGDPMEKVETYLLGFTGAE